MDVSKKILVMGGVKCGKSRFALDRAAEIAGDKIFLATAQALDDDMKGKIAIHQLERGETFVTVEEPIYLARTLGNLKRRPEAIIIDCLTLWICNLIHHFDDLSEIQQQKQLFLDQVKLIDTNVILVTNEVGLGVMPDNQLSRTYIDELGSLNQEVAKLCHEVIMVVSGLPQVLKACRDKTYAKME